MKNFIHKLKRKKHLAQV